MELRQARINDLPTLKQVYSDIVMDLDRNEISIWTQSYPYEAFAQDIEKKQLYILEKDGELVAGFALCPVDAGEQAVQWQDNHGKAFYITRFGVGVEWKKQGIGSLALKHAISLTKQLGGDYLRLFVVDFNLPAIKLYQKNGFKCATGIYALQVEENKILYEFGYEIAV